MLSATKAPWTRDYRFGDTGPTAEAAHRALARAGYLPWSDFSNEWELELERAFDKVDPRDNGSVSGYDNTRWKILRSLKVPAGRPNAGEWALDAYSCKLLQDEAGASGDRDEELVRVAIAEFCRLAIGNEPRIGYRQFRPGPTFVDPRTRYDSDCSLTVIQAFGWARRRTGLAVPDPARQRWSGFGNTDLYEDDHPRIGSPYRVGDIAHFHSPRHVILCMSAGTVSTAEWLSHGRAAGPERVVLSSYSRFPEEFLYVVRPPLLEA